MLAFKSLGEHVALLVLSKCDIETVLAMAQVNRFIRQLAMTKQLWNVEISYAGRGIALTHGTKWSTCVARAGSGGGEIQPCLCLYGGFEYNLSYYI
ncbi:hypothetical protein DFH08DRAFT_976203 [Mycena albidolilacea]|uniref:F-box domain-containing protein n=1 Tax=Mycena albidolilacea TaxID=1033008 RepID=A0AAD6Z357_9AGAR|nr:hypothetical protein DFH08DRAFT_976203 [Mycena albidolilacea]